MKVAEAVNIDGFPSVVVNGEPFYFNNNRWKRSGFTIYSAAEAERVVALFAQNATQFPDWSPTDE